ncbi:hypothetical protein C5167_018169 [Papaver somniferum]|uniref:At4g15545-like C-terminal domain-containing protein n=1 Tax=Papaver somniferum TaxID=3469 RepID=A0A4Y7IQK2_PAPSO|nr:hypothetical protein C5167_018169 [Papaver somniferum]
MREFKYITRGYSSVGSPNCTSGCTTKSQYEGRSVRTSQIDGKEIFRQARSDYYGVQFLVTISIDNFESLQLYEIVDIWNCRSTLSYEQFSAFLSNIKELNCQNQTLEETLRKAE